MKKIFSLGNNNWATKEGKLLACNTNHTETIHYPIELDTVRDCVKTSVNRSGILEHIENDTVSIDFSDNNKGVLSCEASTSFLDYSIDFTKFIYIDITLDTGYLAPDGTNTATKIIANNNNSRMLYYIGNSPYKNTIWAKTTAGTGNLNLLNSSGDSPDLFLITEEWKKFEIENKSDQYFWACDFRADGVTLSEVILWGANHGDMNSYIPTNGTPQSIVKDEISGKVEGNIQTNDLAYLVKMKPFADDITIRCTSISSSDNKEIFSISYWNDSLRVIAHVYIDGEILFYQTYYFDTLEQYLSMNTFILSYSRNKISFFINDILISSKIINEQEKFNDNLYFKNSSFFYGVPRVFAGQIEKIEVYENVNNEELINLN